MKWKKNMFETTNQYMGVSENVVYPKYGYIYILAIYKYYIYINMVVYRFYGMMTNNNDDQSCCIYQKIGPSDLPLK